MSIKYTCFEDVIPVETCKYIKDFFESREDLHVHNPNNPNVIKINHPWKHLKDVLDETLSKYFKTVNGQGGNIFKHKNVYTTHVDSSEPQQMINCLIPIYVQDTAEKQHFVIFDQWVDNGFGQTWYGVRKGQKQTGDFDFNKKVFMTPFDDPRVYDKTDKDIDDDFYKKYLEYDNHEKENFKGLSGVAYEYKPGNLVLFNSNQLHTTGKLIGKFKMGLLINFEGSLDELLL